MGLGVVLCWKGLGPQHGGPGCPQVSVTLPRAIFKPSWDSFYMAKLSRTAAAVSVGRAVPGGLSGAELVAPHCSGDSRTVASWGQGRAVFSGTLLPLLPHTRVSHSKPPDKLLHLSRRVAAAQRMPK